ncbi:MAG: DUF11 domain-containing protein [Clostridiales bacterium]|nr:DUF11 domain-containing protein [Candidatus Scatonaster coprocaballi]
MKKKQVLSAILALAVVVNLFITNPKRKVLAEDPQPSSLDVTKTIDWDYEHPETAKITVTSNVPKVEDTQALFIGTRCRAHGMQEDTLESSINAIAKNADVHYYLVSKDGDKNATISGTVERNDTVKANITTFESNQHQALMKFMDILIEELINKKNSYDYIIFEFDSSRIAASASLNSTNVEKLEKVAAVLKDYYAEDKVLWITDGFDQNVDFYESTPYEQKKHHYGVLPYTPTNITYTTKDTKRGHLTTDQMCALCALVAPDYYLAHMPKKNTGYPVSYSADKSFYGDGEDFTLGSDYTLKPGVKNQVDPLYGNPPDYKVYASDSRQMYYNNTSELADFLYMAIQGVTLTFKDDIHVSVSGSIGIKDITVYATEVDEPTDTDWRARPTFDVKNATLKTDAEGIKYVEDENGEIRVNKGNTGDNASKNNQIVLQATDLKNRLTYVKMVVTVEDTEGFQSCIKLKVDEKGVPLNKDGKPRQGDDEYVYEMNPNDGLAEVKAFKNGNISGKADADGSSLAKAPGLDVCHVKGTVSGGTQNFDTSKQAGTIISSTSDPYLEIVTFKKDTPVYTFAPLEEHEFESITIDGTAITLDDKGSASGTTSQGKYTVETDSKGIITVTFPDIAANRTVDVKFASPEIKLEKSVKSPSAGTVVKAGETITYTIKATNTGKVPVSQFSITDTIDTTKVSFGTDNDGWTYNSNTKTATHPVNTTLAPGESTTVELKVVVLADFEGTDTLVNVAGGKYPNLTPIPTSSPANQPIKGRDIDVKYHVSGEIPSSFTTPSDVKETYGSKMDAAHVTAMTVAPVDGYTFDGWYLKDDLSGSKFDTTKELTGDNFADLKNGGSELNLYGKWKTIKDFTVTKSVTLEDGSAITGAVAPGTKVKYTITVKNNNTYAAISGITVTDTVDSALAISDITPTATTSGQTITWTNLSVAAGGTTTLTFIATVPSDLKVQKTYDNTATLTGAGGETLDKPSNKSSFDAGPENITLKVEKDWSDGWTNHSETVKVRLYKKIASEVNYTPVDPIIELTAANPSKTVSVPPYDKDGNAYDYIFREVIVDASAGTETKLEDGDMNGKYKVSYDTTTAGTTKISNNYVVTAADLEFNKVASSQTIEPGGTLTYTITVKNTRTNPKEIAKGIKITDTLPTGVTLLTTGGLSADKGTANNSGNDITWEIAELGPGVTATLTIKVTVSSDLNLTQLKNTAKITEVGGKEDPKTSPTAPTDVRTFKVTKVWSNPTASHDAVSVILLQNGVQYATNGQVSLDSSNSWTYTWTNLPLNDEEGKPYTYTVKEVEVEGYDTTITYSPSSTTTKAYEYTSATIQNILKTYDVKYHLKSGSEDPKVSMPADEKVDWGTNYNAATPLTASGYVFYGWYTDADCTTKYTDGMTFNDTNVPTGTLDLYCYWKSVKEFEVSKTVTYNGSAITGTVAPGSTVLYTITVKNKNANAPIKNVVISDVVPDGLTISNVSDSGKVTGQSIEWTLDMAKGETKTLTFNATVPADLKVEKKYDNVASVVSADGENVGTKSPTSTFSGKPLDIDLSVAKDWSDKWTSHGSDTVKVRLYRKISTESAYTQVGSVIELTQSVPAETVTVPPYDKDGNEYTYIFREVVDKSGIETPLEDGDKNGRYKVSYDTTTKVGTTNILNTYIIDATDLEFKKTASDLAAPGDVLTYTITVKNLRTYETATNVVITDELPDGVTLVTPDGLVFTSPDTAVDDGKGNITWTIQSIAPGETAKLEIKVNVDPKLDASRLENIAQIKDVGGTSYTPGEFPSPPALTDIRTFTAKKIWSNPTAEHDAVTVVLLQNGQPYAVNPSVELSSTNDWTYTWTKLPLYDASKNYYVYTVEEVAVPGYSTLTSYSGGTYGNTSVDIKNTLKTYDISYQIVGDVKPEGVPAPSGDTVDWGTKYTAKDKLSKEYYTFSGWFEDDACTTPYVDGTVINDTTAPGGKKVLYGKWTRLTTDITFQPGNGKSPNPGDVIYPKDTTMNRGDDFPMPADPIYNGDDFKFGGWFLDPDCTIPYVPGPLTDGELPLYAKWTYQPTVSYKFVGDDIPSDVKLPATERIPAGTAYDADKKTTSTDNYTFDGWYVDSGCTKKYEDGTKIYENTVLYGKWTRKTTDINLLPGAGAGPNPDDVTYPTIPPGKRGDILPMPEDPIYNGDDYKFAGWFLDPDCTIPYVPGPMTSPEIKLYAKWTQLPIVRYHFVGEVPNGVYLPQIDIIQPGTSYKTLAPSGTTTLYVFDGWYLDVACTQRFVEGSKITKDMALYGKWLAVIPKTGAYTSANVSLAALFVLSAAGIVLYVSMEKKRRYYRH